MSSLLAAENNAYFRTFTIASVSGVYSLFPLLFTPGGEYILYHALINDRGGFSRNLRKNCLFLGLGLPYNSTFKQTRVRVSVLFFNVSHKTSCSRRFPASLPWVILDTLERLYIAGFALLQVFVTLFPLFSRSRTSHEASQDTTETSSALEFLPLMLTSVYCAVGLVWAFVRLSVTYLRQ